jgi:nitroreductase
MTECMDVIYQRRSIRKFKTDPISKEIIEKLLKAAQMAPSAGNLQARDFIVVTNPVVKKKLSEVALNQQFLVQAPVVIVLCANVPRSSRVYSGRGELYSIQDTTASLMILMLAAQDLGLGTCWVGAFSEADVSEILMIPPHINPICLLALGYPAESPPASDRMDISKITHMESW